MKVVVSLDQAVRSIGVTEAGHEAIFDTSIKGGGLASAPSPVEHLLQAAGACMLMDIVPLLQKRRKNVIGLTIEIEGTRREEHPRIFTQIHMVMRLVSPDVTQEELDYCIALSDEKYCTITNTLKLAGAAVTYESHISREPALSDMERANQTL